MVQAVVSAGAAFGAMQAGEVDDLLDLGRGGQGPEAFGPAPEKAGGCRGGPGQPGAGGHLEQRGRLGRGARDRGHDGLVAIAERGGDADVDLVETRANKPRPQDLGVLAADSRRDGVRGWIGGGEDNAVLRRWRGCAEACAVQRENVALADGGRSRVGGFRGPGSVNDDAVGVADGAYVVGEHAQSGQHGRGGGGGGVGGPGAIGDDDGHRSRSDGGWREHVHLILADVLHVGGLAGDLDADSAQRGGDRVVDDVGVGERSRGCGQIRPVDADPGAWRDSR